MTTNYQDLLNQLNPPVLYEQRDLSIWQEDHVSRQLLNAHLDPQHDGASRKPAFIARSVDWLTTTIPPTTAPVLLDVGCGPGLYAEPLCRQGYQVTGLDFSRPSLDYAQQSAKANRLSIRYQYQNYLAMEFQCEFDLAIMIYCDYGALSPADRHRLLRRLYQALKPGGQLLLDVFTTSWLAQKTPAQTWEYCPNGGFWQADPYLELKGCYKYPETPALADRYHILTAYQVREFLLWNTCFTPQTLEAECAAAGFQHFRRFADVTGAPYEENSETLCLLMKK